ncbi:MAG: AraC family transcriptional regulator [Bacteroidota bacterium]
MAALFYKNGDLKLYGKNVPSECWKVKKSTEIIAYFFKPFVAPALFNVDAKTEVVELGAIDKGNIDQLLIGKLNDNCKVIQYATDQIMLDPSPDILSAVIKHLKINERTFQRIFKKYVGITANQYRRICQFQSSFSQLRSNDFQSLTDLAYANGFADQSHFIRSFKEFVNTTPNNYLKEGLKK